MFGSDIIRIKIKGYLKNITDNEIFEFEEKGIRNKNKITFNNNNIKPPSKPATKPTVKPPSNGDNTNNPGTNTPESGGENNPGSTDVETPKPETKPEEDTSGGTSEESTESQL